MTRWKMEKGKEKKCGEKGKKTKGFSNFSQKHHQYSTFFPYHPHIWKKSCKIYRKNSCRGGGGNIWIFWVENICPCVFFLNGGLTFGSFRFGAGFHVVDEGEEKVLVVGGDLTLPEPTHVQGGIERGVGIKPCPWSR